MNLGNLHEEYKVIERSDSNHNIAGKGKDKHIDHGHNTQTCSLSSEQTPFTECTPTHSECHSQTHKHKIFS